MLILTLVFPCVVWCIIYTDTNKLLCKNSSNIVDRPPWNLSYAPFTITCPKGKLIRQANEKLCNEEYEYISNRNKKTELSLESLFYRNKIPHFDVCNFWSIKAKPTRIAIAISGGGYRSMITSGGILLSFDNRYSQSNLLGGLLQSTSYIAGISGGAWLVLSNFINDFECVDKLVHGGWNFEDPLLLGVPKFEPDEMINKQNTSGIFQLVLNWFKTDDDKKKDTNKFWLTNWIKLLIEVKDKKKAGFHTSFTDYFGRALVRKIFKATARTPGTTITAATRALPSFLEYDQPFPIACTIEKDPSIPGFSSHLDSHCFEFTPYEFGSWDSYLNAFVPMKYLGTTFQNGESVNKSTNFSYCVSGFDNVGFVTGTSSSLFNHVFLIIHQMLESYQSETTTTIKSILKALGLSSEWNGLKLPNLHPDYALYSPNPFYQYGTTNISNNSDLYLVDGGDDGQNIPFHPFLNAAREVDIIFAYDMTNERDNYPNGTVLARTSQRYKQTNNSNIQIPYFEIPQGDSIQEKIIKSIFPKVPTPEQIIQQELTKNPIFLGCDIIEDYETLEVVNPNQVRPIGYLPPLIIYHANNEYSYASNTSTFQLSYNQTEVYGMINNGFNLATNNNSTIFSICMNCAILKREFDRISYGLNTKSDGFVVPKICQKCYKTFCWRD
ncbi:PLB2 Lysophospholipase 2 [Candida maltosa Xu316]